MVTQRFAAEYYILYNKVWLVLSHTLLFLSSATFVHVSANIVLLCISVNVCTKLSPIYLTILHAFWKKRMILFCFL